ncbi:MAG: SPASM domain-containing protein, partial [Flavobacteriales bacterium]|nr:SPASM domain-containing protein [Flavobacteriales bacterium]
LKMNIKSFQITVDGTKNTHDNSRHTKELKPTFDIIFNNIIKAAKSSIYLSENVHISIRVNVHKNNVNEIDDLIDFLYSKEIHNKVDLYFAAVHDWGNNKADEKIGLSQNEFAEREIDWLIKMNDLGFKKSTILPPAITGTCMTTSDDSELIDATGKVSYCWEVPYTDEFIKDTSLTIGNLNEAKEMTYNKSFPLRDWFNDIKSGTNNSSNCKNCIFLPNCGGACPISWYKGNPACPSFKFNIEDRLIMEYLSVTENQPIEAFVENN